MSLHEAVVVVGDIVTLLIGLIFVVLLAIALGAILYAVYKTFEDLL